MNAHFADGKHLQENATAAFPRFANREKWILRQQRIEFFIYVKIIFVEVGVVFDENVQNQLGIAHENAGRQEFVVPYPGVVWEFTVR